VAEVPLPHLRGQPSLAEVLYPAEGQHLPNGEVSWEPATATVTVALPETPAACLIRLRA
jgi:hypothetical protein